MDPFNTSNAGLYGNQAFPPKDQGTKRKRDGSPPPDSAAVPAIDNTSIQMNLAHRPKPKETHDGKRRRGDSPENDTQIDPSLAVASSGKPTATKNTNAALALGNLSLHEPVAKRLRRRKAPVSCFIPKKQSLNKKAVIRKPRPQPVFGQASLYTADEVKLSTAVKVKPAQVQVAKNLDNLPKPTADPQLDPGMVMTSEEKYVDEDERIKPIIPVEDDEFCVRRAISDNTMVHCEACFEIYHPACVGKGLQGSALYDGDGDREYLARVEDAKHYIT